MMQHYDRTTITEEQKIIAVMNPNEWVDLYAIAAKQNGLSALRR